MLRQAGMPYSRKLLSGPRSYPATDRRPQLVATHFRLAFSARSAEHAWRSCAICAATGSRFTIGLLRMLRARFACRKGRIDGKQ